MIYSIQSRFLVRSVLDVILRSPLMRVPRVGRIGSVILTLLTGILCNSVNADSICYSPVAEKKGDIGSKRGSLEPFDYKIQVDDGPVVKPASDRSTRYPFSSSNPLVKIYLGNELVESFHIPDQLLAEGRNCVWFYNLYETWSIVETWQAAKLCKCANDLEDESVNA